MKGKLLFNINEEDYEVSAGQATVLVPSGENPFLHFDCHNSHTHYIDLTINLKLNVFRSQKLNSLSNYEIFQLLVQDNSVFDVGVYYYIRNLLPSKAEVFFCCHTSHVDYIPLPQEQ